MPVSLLSEESAISGRLDGHGSRPQQLEMTVTLAATPEYHSHPLVEAGAVSLQEQLI